MADWTAPAFVDALVTALAARSGIANLTAKKVSVLDYWPSPNDDVGDAVIIGYNVSDVNEPAALGQNRYQEEVDLSCHIRVVRDGSGAQSAKAARDRAADLLGEVDNQLRTGFPNVGDQTISAHIKAREMDQPPGLAAGVGTRVCLIDFTITYKSRTSASS